MGLRTLLKESANELFDKELIREVLKKAGASKTFRRSVLREADISQNHLKKLQADHLERSELKPKIRSFLKKRWACIQNNDLGYVSFPHSPMNQICIKLAKAIAEPGESLAQILMPTLKIDDYIVTGESLVELTENQDEEERELLLTHFFISDDGKAIIPITAWFGAQAQNKGEYFNHLYAVDGKEIALSQYEIEALRTSAMPHSDNFFEELDLRKRMMSAKGTLSAALLKFCCDLKNNGMGAKGTLHKAHDDVFESIREFDVVLKGLTDSDRENIFKLQAGGKNFRFYWNVLSGFDGKSRSKNAPTCVQENAADLLAILKAHPDEFSKIKLTPEPTKEKASSEPKISPFSVLCEKVQEKIDSRQRSIQKYLSRSRPLDGVDALKFYYKEDDEFSDTLSIYAWDLKTEDYAVRDLSIETLHDLAYFQAVLTDEEIDALLQKLDDEKLEELYDEAIKTNLWLAEFLIGKSYFTPPESALVDAVKDNDISFVRAYIKAKRPLDHGVNTPNGSALFLAVKENKVEISVLLVEGGADCSEKYGTDLDPLLVYAAVEMPALCDALIKRGNIDVDVCFGKKQETALHLAATHGNVELARLLLEHKADIHKKNATGETPLSLTAVNGHVEMAELLLSKDAKMIDGVNNKGESVLHLAVKRNKLELVKYLISKGVNINLKDSEGNTPLSLAVGRSHEPIVCALVEAGAVLPTLELSVQSDKPAEPLVPAIDEDPLFQAFSSRVRQNTQFVETWNPKTKSLLIYAIEKQWPSLVKSILTRKDVDVNAKDVNGQTVLGHVLIQGLCDVLPDIIKKGADPKIKDKDGHSPLFHAIKNNREWMACQLVSAGVDYTETFTHQRKKVSIMDYAIELKKYYLLMAWMDARGPLDSISKENLNNALNHFLLLPHPKTVERYIKRIISAGAYPDNMFQNLAYARIDFTVNEMIHNPSRENLRRQFGLEGLCQLCNVPPDDFSALRLFASCVEISLPKTPEGRKLSGKIHEAIFSNSAKALCDLIKDQTKQKSSYSRNLTPVNPWEDMPQSLKNFVNNYEAESNNNSSKKRTIAQTDI